jgi:hypothetical protein
VGIETTITLLLAAALFASVGLLWLAVMTPIWIYRRLRPAAASESRHPEPREWPRRRPVRERLRPVLATASSGLATGVQFMAAHVAAWGAAAFRGVGAVALASGRVLKQMSATTAGARDASALATSQALRIGYRSARQRSIELGERTFARIHDVALSNPASSFFDPESIAQETLWRNVASQPVPEIEIRRRSVRKVMILRGPALTNFFTWLGR